MTYKSFSAFANYSQLLTASTCVLIRCMCSGESNLQPNYLSFDSQSTQHDEQGFTYSPLIDSFHTENCVAFNNRGNIVFSLEKPTHHIMKTDVIHDLRTSRGRCMIQPTESFKVSSKVFKNRAHTVIFKE